MAVKEDENASLVAVDSMDSNEFDELSTTDNDKAANDCDASRLKHSGDVARNEAMRKSSPSSPSSGIFDGDDLVVELIAELVEESMTRSVEAFYERNLCGYTAQSASDAMFEVLLSVLQVQPYPKCERNGSEVNRENDPVMLVVYPPEKALHIEPQRSEIDPFCWLKVPLRAPEKPPVLLIPIKRRHDNPSSSNCGDRRDWGAQSSSFRTQKAVTVAHATLSSPSSVPPMSPTSLASAATQSHRANTSNPTSEYHVPGMVYSTAPPLRISPRKAMTLLKNAHRISVGSTVPATAAQNSIGQHAPGEAEQLPSASGGADESGDSDMHDEDSSAHSYHAKGHRQYRDSFGNADTWGLDGFVHEEEENDFEIGGESNLDENTPIQVEFVIKKGRGGGHHLHGQQRCPNSASQQAPSFLPELSPSPQRRLSRNASLPTCTLNGVMMTAPPHSNSESARHIVGQHDDDAADNIGHELYSKDRASIHSQLRSMVLAPGVKLQNGDETKTGPELPRFPTRMRKATFYGSVELILMGLTLCVPGAMNSYQQNDAITLTLAASAQSLHSSSASFLSKSLHPLPPGHSHTPYHQLDNIFLTECSEASLNDSNEIFSERDETSSSRLDILCGSQCISSKPSNHRHLYPHPHDDHHDHQHNARAKKPASPSASTSSSSTSSTSSMLFKRISKVQRPCTTPATKTCHGSCSVQVAQHPNTTGDNANNSSSVSPPHGNNSTDFKDLAKQRAFIRKASFVAAPSVKKLNIREKDRERRPSTATGGPTGGPPSSRKCLHFCRARLFSSSFRNFPSKTQTKQSNQGGEHQRHFEEAPETANATMAGRQPLSSSSPSPPSQRTQYGTSSLESDESLRQTTERRRKIVKWSATALVVAAGAALIAMSVTSGSGSGATPTSAAASTAASAPEAAAAAAGADMEKEVKCWQSSYINGEKKMMEPISGLKWKKRGSESLSSFIAVDANKKYQEMFGFGGAFTEASALQFAKLSHEKQEEVLKLYFDKEGAAYDFGRVPMGSCDFSVSSYSFDDIVNDTSMSHFDDGVEHDTAVLIPFIQRALEKNPKLKMFLAPWSPPAWMKRAADNYVPSMLGSATPVGLKDEMQSAWALYFSKFITAYKAFGINFWGLTPQNEPEFAAPWEACGYNASYQAEFVANHLGPVIKRDHPDVKIMVFDHNRASVRQWAETIFLHPEAKKYVDGIAFHWYDDERYMDGVEFHERLNDTHYVDESRFILATESCNCPGVAQGKDAWFRGQRYAHDIITDFNNWVVGWVDWNLILDHTGGPNHLGNNCDAPIIIDETEKDYYLQPMYYFIKHFSKYVPPGSRRIHTEVSATFKQPGDAQLFPRYPSALHSCDNSSRQAIHVTEDSKLQVTGTPYCIDLVRPQWLGRQVELVECRYTSQSWTFTNGQIRMDDHCLALNHGSTKDGARITVHDCRGTEDAEHERWYFKNGQMHSAASPKCVTAGYSFVQSVGFVTPENKKVLVVLNENTEDADFDLQFGDASVETTIPQGAIRTFQWE